MKVPQHVLLLHLCKQMFDEATRDDAYARMTCLLAASYAFPYPIYDHGVYLGLGVVTLRVEDLPAQLMHHAVVIDVKGVNGKVRVKDRFG